MEKNITDKEKAAEHENSWQSSGLIPRKPTVEEVSFQSKESHKLIINKLKMDRYISLFTVRQPIEENNMRGKTSRWKKGRGFLMPEKTNAGESQTGKTERWIKR